MPTNLLITCFINQHCCDHNEFLDAFFILEFKKNVCTNESAHADFTQSQLTVQRARMKTKLFVNILYTQVDYAFVRVHY